MGRGQRSIALVLLGVLLGGMTVAAGQTSDSGEPALRVERRSLDLGTVKAGEDVVATFVFRNAGTEPVKIIRAKPS